MRSTTHTTLPVQKITAALLLMLGLSGLPAAVAQTAGDDEERAQADKTATADTAEDVEDAQDRNSDDGESPASGAGVVLSPFDYEASESISEDSSVSFPVDI